MDCGFKRSGAQLPWTARDEGFLRSAFPCMERISLHLAKKCLQTVVFCAKI